MPLCAAHSVSMPVCAAFFKVCHLCAAHSVSMPLCAATAACHQVLPPAGVCHIGSSRRTCQAVSAGARLGNSSAIGWVAISAGGGRLCGGAVLARAAGLRARPPFSADGPDSQRGSDEEAQPADSSLLSRPMARDNSVHWSSVAVLLAQGGYSLSRSLLREGDGGTVGTLHVLTALTNPPPTGCPRGEGCGSEARVYAHTSITRRVSDLVATACVRASPSCLSSGAAQF